MGIGSKEILWNATENVGQEDLNAAQRFARALACDWMLGSAGSFVGSGDVGAARFDRTKALFCMGDSGAPYPAVTPLVTLNLGGPICQWKPFSVTPPGTNNADWGDDAGFQVFWLTDNQLSTTHAAGDSTNPRWDMVCIKLDTVDDDVADQETRLQRQVVSGAFVTGSGDFIKRRKVTLTKQLVVGTPAGTPAIPAVPSGFLPLYAVLVPAGFTGVFPMDNNFHDYRMPLGSFCIDIYPAEQHAWQTDQTNNTINVGAGGFGSVTMNNTHIDLSPRFPVSAHSCRLLGVSHLSHLNSAGTIQIKLARYNPNADGTFNQMGGNSHWSWPPLIGDAFLDGMILPTSGSPASFSWYKSALTGGAGNTPPTAAIKPPWGTGWPSGYASRRERSILSPGLSLDVADQLGIQFSSTSSERIIMVRLHFAGMPY